MSREAKVVDAFRQGELLILKLEPGLDLTYRDISKHKDDRVLAEGEATGHMHEVVEGITDLWELPSGRTYITGEITLPAGQMLLEVKEKAKLIHPDHKPILLGQGLYVIRTQREYDEAQEHLVRD